MIIAAALIMTAGLLFYVFSPPARLEQAPEKTRLGFLRERKETIYENLRDLNFEYKAGKVPEADYLSLRTSLEDEAAAALAEIDLLEKAVAFANPEPKGAKI